MKNNRQLLRLLTVSATLFLMTSVADAKVRKWNQKMQELGKTFSDLLPELSDSRPITPASKRKLEKGAKKILDLAHTINMGPGTQANPLPPEADPTIQFVSGIFEREVRTAYRAIQDGYVPYGRTILRTMSGYCIACHTRHDQGPDFPGMALNPKTESLTDMERAELLIATRQFDAALDAFDIVAGDAGFAKSNPIQWGRGIHYAFVLAIRVKKDPARALALMERVGKMPQAPVFYSAHFPAWKKSIEEWKKEPPKKFETEDALLDEANRLTNAARQLQKYPSDRSADVLYLRASAVLHELLTRYPGGKHSSEAMMLTGAAYELLEDRLTVALPDLYYESCIRNTPHTPIAEQCYGRYEQNILFGYSGSAGSFIPQDIKTLMGELRELSKVGKK